MRLKLTGHPLHSRLQTIAARRGADGSVAVEGAHLDLRKRGFVPVGADLQASGIVHQMSVQAILDPVQRRLSEIESSMMTPAFEPSELTRGESCRDVAGRLKGVAELSLDDAAARQISAAMGGVHGCSHLLALTQLTASTMRDALRTERDWDSGPPRRLFHRSLVIDGTQPAERVIEIGVQLSDLFFAPAAAVANPMDRFARQYELRVLARVDLDGVILTELAVAERERGRDDLADAAWRRRDDSVAALLAAPFLGGFASRVFQSFPDTAVDRPLVDVLLGLAPAFI